MTDTLKGKIMAGMSENLTKAFATILIAIIASITTLGTTILSFQLMHIDKQFSEIKDTAKMDKKEVLDIIKNLKIPPPEVELELRIHTQGIAENKAEIRDLEREVRLHMQNENAHNHNAHAH